MTPAENLEHTEATLDLGRRIAKQLSSRGDEDLICEWMGHYLAELIVAVDNDPSDRQSSDDCVKTVLEIWAHKSSLPDGTRPFEDLEAVVKTLQALDPNSTTSFFANNFRLDDCTDLKNENTWIELSRSIDRAARVVIQCCLEQAASELAGNSAEWAEIAKKAQVDLGIFDPILLLTHGTDDENAKVIRKKEKERIKSRIEHLDRILEVSAPLKHELQKSLEKLENET
jgi:hypothetical protein